MKLLRYGDPGQEKPGLLDTEGNIRDVSAHLPDLAKQYIDPDNLAKLAGIEIDSLPRGDQSVRIGPCVGSIGKFICIGLNYSDHAAETSAT